MVNPFFENAGFSSNDLTWRTPKKFFADLDKEFNFVLDACALSSSALKPNWYGPDHPDPERRDCLVRDWLQDCGGGMYL